MNIILFGPPGAGKGTQADNVAKKFNLEKISTGDLLRIEIKNNTQLGAKIKSTIDQGKFVSDEIINELILQILNNKKEFFDKLIFDGYPRNINQAKKLNLMLKQSNQKISFVLNLNVKKDIIIKRISGRVVCSNCGLTFNKYFNTPEKNNHKCNENYLNTRDDDNVKTAESRFETYTKETLPLLRYYKDQKILKEIDGTREINQIYDEICSIITTLET